MKKSAVFSCFYVVAFFLLMPGGSYAQSAAPNPSNKSSQDPVVQELLSEVRQLRIALQRMSVNGYRVQVIVERLRLQQEMVNHLTRELNGVRNEISEMKGLQSVMKQQAEEADKQKDQGQFSEAQAASVKVMMGDFKRREQSLTEREAKLSTELEIERLNLESLNKRLDALEREMVGTLDEESKPARKDK
jgi:hypothetical protein